MKFKGIAFTILSALLFGITPILASATYTLGSTPETLTFYRNALALPILLLVLVIKKIDLRLSQQELGKIALIGVIGCGTTTLLLYSSYRYISIGSATSLHFLYPIFVALTCRIFYNEHLGLQKIAALIAAGIGTLLFINKSQSADRIGLALAITSGFTYAFYIVGIDKQGLTKLNPYKVSFYIALMVSVFMLLYNVFAPKIIFLLPMKAMIFTGIISVCTSVLAVVFLQLGIKYLDATTAAIFCLFEPVTSMVFSRIFLEETITFTKLTGSVLILTAVAVTMIRIPSPNHRKNAFNNAH